MYALFDTLADLHADWAVRATLWLALWALGVRILRIPSGAPRHAVWLIALGALALLPFVRLPEPKPIHTDPLWHAAEAAWISLDGSAKTPQTATNAIVAKTPIPIWQTLERRLSLSCILGAVWLLGVLFMALQFLRGYIDLKRLVQTATPITDPAWQHLLHTQATRLGLSQSVALKSSADLDGPVSAGWRHPVVLLPKTMATPTEDAHRVLIHELAHIRRRDFLVTVFQRLCEICFFYHPLVWYASHHLTLHRELACDDWVLSHSPNRRAYALSLIDHVGQPGHTPRVGAALFGSPSRLAVRIQQIMNAQRAIMPHLSKRALTIFLLIACVGLTTIGCFALVRTGRLNADVQTLMQQAIKAASHADRQTANLLAEQATGHALSERANVDRKRNLLHVLETRAAWTTDPATRRQYYTSALDLAEQLKNRATQARLHLQLGLNVADSIGLPHLQTAQRLYASIGDTRGEGNVRLWQASKRLNNGHFTRAEAEFRHAKRLIGTQNPARAATCTAASELLARPDRDHLTNSHTGYAFGNTTLRIQNNIVNFLGEGGSSRSASINNRRSLANRSVFHEAGLLGDFFPPDPTVGTRWGTNVRSFGQFPLQGFGMVLDDNATITVPAGTFTGCLHIRIQVSRTPETLSESRRIDTLNKLISGVRDVYYAPGVGIVKIEMELKNGAIGDLVLTNVQIANQTDAYLPLDVGNTWTYTWQDTQSNLFNEQILQVRHQTANIISLSRHHIAYAKEGTP